MDVANDDLTAIGVLTDPTRRAVYEVVVDTGRPVSRDDVSEAVGIARQTAAYHLDMLVDHGLLEAEYARLTGKSGPGAGRPAKVYRRSEREHSVTIPPRRYGLAAQILLTSVTTSPEAHANALDAAERIGQELGSGGLEAALAATGYEPVTEGDEVRFRNCPFHLLVEQQRDTTCALNLALVQGLVAGSGESRRVVLAPEDGYCCVRLSTA